MAGVAGEEGEIDADLAQGTLPLVVERVVEDQLLIGRHGQPGIGLQLLIELTRAPAGITQSENAPPRAGAR